MTIHNIAYQGNFWHWDMELTGIDWKYFNWRQMEFYGNLNFLKTRPGVRRHAQHRQPALRPGDSVARRWAAAWKASCRTATTICSASSTASTTASGTRKPIRYLNGHNYGVKNFAEGKAGLQGGAAARSWPATSRRTSR